MTRKRQYVILFVALILGGVNMIVTSLINGKTTLKPNEIANLATFVQAIESGTYSDEFDNELKEIGIEKIEKKENDVWLVETENKGEIIFFDNAKSEDYILIEVSFYKLAKKRLNNYAFYTIGILLIYVECDFLYWFYQKNKNKKICNEQPETSQTKKEVKQNRSEVKAEKTPENPGSKKQGEKIRENNRSVEERKTNEQIVEEVIIKKL